MFDCCAQNVTCKNLTRFSRSVRGSLPALRQRSTFTNCPADRHCRFSLVVLTIRFDGAARHCAGENSAPDQIEPRMPRSGSRGLMTPDILSQPELTAGRTVSQGNAASGFPCSYATATESSTSPNFLSGFFKNESYPVRYACSNCA